MDKFTTINYGNDWGIYVDIENDEDKYSNNKYTICVNDNKNIYYDKDVKNVNTIFVTLFISGFLIYTIYFVL